jgi:enolase-phosphatase E1
MLRTVVIDIEGTTSPTDFVTGRLYPYSAERLAGWIASHPGDPVTCRAVDQVRELIGDRQAGPDSVVSALLDWIAADEKITPLKTLQGLIWDRAFADGELAAPFYPDSVPALRAWKAAGHSLYVFSSGSEAAQRAWFGHSAAGDLRSLISGYFDTESAGPKRAPGAYRAIAAATGESPAHTAFLSDVVAELDAAREAGWHTARVRRPGEKYYADVGAHLEVASLAELDLAGDRPSRIRPAGPRPAP